MRAIDEMGYQEPTPIQQRAIPIIMEGHDVLGKSHTGTGKTAAFGIPAIQTATIASRYPSAMIIAPTRELVMQIATELRKFSKYQEGIKIVPIYGGQPIDRQIQMLKKGCNIIVGTPGRIMDHLRRHTLKFVDLKMVILDEADEMLNMGFKEDIESILYQLPKDKKHQTILFSATWPKTILAITKQFQKDPKQIEVDSGQRTIDTVEQIYYDVARGKKANALRVVLHHYEPDICMIFCNTKKMVDELSNEFKKYDIKSITLHGDMKQDQRMRVMDQFRKGDCSILIASDVAARGIDINNIDLVVNFDIPQDQEYYIHRVGRTGRAGKKGIAVTLVSGKKQKMDMQNLIRYTKTNITKHMLPTSTQMMQKNLESYINKVKEAASNDITEISMEIANQLMSEGIAAENIISALISMSFKNEIIDVEEEKLSRYAKEFDKITLRFSIGSAKQVQTNNIVAAISEETSISSKSIGKIDVQKNYSLVDIDARKADKVLQAMQGNTIKGILVSVEIDHAPKRKNQRNHNASQSRHRPNKRKRT